MTDTLHIEILPHLQVTPELDEKIDHLDHIAFNSEDDHDDPEFDSIRWASHDWMVLGWLDEMLVSQLCLLKREILVGGAPVWVAGIGGVATHPDYQHRGLGSQIMAACPEFMAREIKVPFGLLICADETRPFYEKSGWQFVAPNLFYSQDNERRNLETCVMIFPLSAEPWPAGEIDLCGAPW